MSGKEVYPWIAVNGYMRDDYRETVVELALRHLPRASADLSRFSKRVFSTGIPVNGYRSVLRAPVRVAKEPVAKSMQARADVAAAIICLWAEQCQDCIDTVQKQAQAAGFVFQDDWSWQKARDGFCAPESVKPFAELVDVLAASEDSPNDDHFRLAGFWLNRALVADTSTSEAGDPVDAELSQVSPEPYTQSDETAGRPPGAADTAHDQLEAGQDDLSTAGMTPMAPGGGQIVDLEALTQTLEASAQGVAGAQESALADAQALVKAVQDSDFRTAMARADSAREALDAWRQALGALDTLVEQATRAVLRELKARPDLDSEKGLSDLVQVPPESAASAESQAEAVSMVVSQIGEYDQAKQEVLCQLDRAQSQIEVLRAQVSEWTQDTLDDGQYLLDAEGDPSQVTLAEARAMLAEALGQQRVLDQRLSQLIESERSRVQSLAHSLQTMGLPVETEIVGEIELGHLDPTHVDRIPLTQLQELRQHLENLIREQTAQMKEASYASAAADLRREWSEAKLGSLLEGLAAQKCDAEAALLLVAANSVHPRSDELVLGDPVVDSLLRGLEQLSTTLSQFGLLNLLASEMCPGCKTADQISEAKLRLSLLAAQYAGTYWLPEWLLWQQFPGLWPIHGMPGWDALWQAGLVRDALPIMTDDESTQLVSNLEAARHSAVQALERESGAFIRLRSLKSKRHQALLSKEFMPRLAARLGQIQKMEKGLSASPGSGESARLLGQLKKLVSTDLRDDTDEDDVADEYSASASSAGIDDSDPFHRRVSIRIIRDCAQSLYEYGLALLHFETARIQQGHTVTRARLEDELAVSPELEPLGGAVLGHLIQCTGREHSERDETECRMEARQQLTREILRDAYYALRLPHVVGYLTASDLEWSELLGLLLEDLSEISTGEESARVLFNHQAPTQALLLAQHLPLDLQKQAQRQMVEHEREIGELTSQLLKSGGSIEGLARDRELGRWRLLKNLLQEQLDLQHREIEAGREQDRQRRLELLHRIHSLEEQVYDREEEMPRAAVRFVEKGFSLARRAARQAGLASHVGDYLTEMEYRLTHTSWPLDELQDAVERLEAALSDQEQSRGSEIDIEEVLELLEHGELRRLGISPDRMDPSTIETRCSVLRSWLDVRDAQGFLSQNLSSQERRAIQDLFGHFARMSALSRVRVPDGSHLAYESPAIFSHWELRFPKTAELDNNCVFVALPGNPPTAESLGQLEALVEEKEWLDWCFVFLFVPGCSPRMQNRLRSLNQNRGLVVIDESALRYLLLSESAATIPVARLRPLMLNARNAATISVFKTNQLVDLRTSIFVGRDALIRQIASGGDNYAIYGGRRIGKSSVLHAVKDRLNLRNVQVVFHSFEGDPNCSDDACAETIGRLLKLEIEITGVDDLKFALQTHLDESPELNLVLLLDEIDRYILSNPQRHVLIEALRTLSDSYGPRFRVVIVGFMSLHACLQGRGPYTPTSDPWRRMLNDIGPLGNLRAASAERIVQEGFLNILGWQFEHHAIPQLVVERTGGHPAFVQGFCSHLQSVVAARGERVVRVQDVENVFNNPHPDQSFIAYVRNTLELNLDAISHYLVLWLAMEDSETQSFTWDQAREIADLCNVEISNKQLERSLERLKVTSVVQARRTGLYEFSVPDYPMILRQLQNSSHVEELEDQIERYQEAQNDLNR